MLSYRMLEEAKKLQEELVLVAYKDHKIIRMETEYGKDPYVWRGGQWKAMKN